MLLRFDINYYLPHMSIYAVPSFLALIVKAWLFWFSRDSLLTHNRPLGLFLLALFCLNLAEFNLFFYVDKPEKALGMMLFYWSSAIASVASFLYLASRLAGYSLSSYLLLSAAVLMILTVVTSDFFIAGTTAIAYSVTRIKGEYYLLLQLYVLFHLFFGLFLLAQAGRNHSDVWVRKKCSVVFLSMLPTVLAVTVVLLLMHLEFDINATGIVSVTIIFFLAAIIFTESKYSLLNLLTIALTSKESLYFKQILIPEIHFLCSVYSGKKMRIKEELKEFERVLIMVALEENNGNRHHTAEQLGLSKAGLDTKLRNLNLS